VGSRRGARRTAIDVLFQADLTRADPASVLGGRVALGEHVDPFARELVEGVVARLGEIDDILASRAEGWAVERMPSVDRTILRVAVFELLARPDVPPSVAISEAVQAANDLSTDDSGRFVNGVLGRLSRELGAPAEGAGGAGR